MGQLCARTKPLATSITAAVYRVERDRELRVWSSDGDNLLDSLLSRTDDAPLEYRAEQVRAVLLEKGWTEG